MLEADNEKTGSVLVSAAGAWLGLGAGLALMVLSFLAVTGLVVGKNVSSNPRATLQRYLAPDVDALVPGSVHLSADGAILTMTLRSADGSEQKVNYSASEGRLARNVEGGQSRLVASYLDLKFSLKNSLLTATWTYESAPESLSWAVDRW